MSDLILLMFLLFTKHFIIDFIVQTPYQYLNKGIYGHLGGVLHASLHVIGTAASLIILNYEYFIMLSLVDGVIHYHIDWAKTNINKFYGWACNTTDKFWVLTGLDQYLHTLTYLGIAGYIYAN